MEKEAKGATTNVRDGFLQARVDEKRDARIIMRNGYQFYGRIKDFDDFAVTVEAEGVEQMLYHSAISTIRQTVAASPHWTNSPYGGARQNPNFIPR